MSGPRSIWTKLDKGYPLSKTGQKRVKRVAKKSYKKGQKGSNFCQRPLPDLPNRPKTCFFFNSRAQKIVGSRFGLEGPSVPGSRSRVVKVAYATNVCILMPSSLQYGEHDLLTPPNPTTDPSPKHRSTAEAPQWPHPHGSRPRGCEPSPEVHRLHEQPGALAPRSKPHAVRARALLHL